MSPFVLTKPSPPPLFETHMLLLAREEPCAWCVGMGLLWAWFLSPYPMLQGLLTFPKTPKGLWQGHFPAYEDSPT